MLTAEDIENLIFRDGNVYGDDGSSHKCAYTDKERILFIENYAHQSQNYRRISSEDFENLKKFHHYISHNIKNRYPKQIKIDFMRKLPIIHDGFAVFGKGSAGMPVMNMLITQIHMTIGRMIDWYEKHPELITNI